MRLRVALLAAALCAATAPARDTRIAGVPAGAGAVRLPGRAGELRISWRVPVRSSSFDGVTAALRKSHRKRGAAPPG